MITNVFVFLSGMAATVLLRGISPFFAHMKRSCRFPQDEDFPYVPNTRLLRLAIFRLDEQLLVRQEEDSMHRECMECERDELQKHLELIAH